jgi:hypothetical protein
MRKLTKVRECNRGFGLLYVNAVNPEMPLFVASGTRMYPKRLSREPANT